MSFPQKRESTIFRQDYENLWIPAFAGMTISEVRRLKTLLLIGSVIFVMYVGISIANNRSKHPQSGIPTKAEIVRVLNDTFKSTGEPAQMDMASTAVSNGKVDLPVLKDINRKYRAAKQKYLGYVRPSPQDRETAIVGAAR